MRNVLFGFLLVASGSVGQSAPTPQQSYTTEAKCRAAGSSLTAQFYAQDRYVVWACIPDHDE